MSKDERPDLDAIEARAQAATPGPWVAGDYDWSTHDVMDEAHMKHLARVYLAPGEANTRFIAHARTDVPALVAYARRLEARLQTVTAAFNTGKETARKLHAAQDRVRELEAEKRRDDEADVRQVARLMDERDAAIARVRELEEELAKR